MNFAARRAMAGAVVWLGLIGFAVSPAPCRAEAIRVNALKIPVPNSGSSGPRTVQLDAIVLRPDDGQPHPLALVNHGSPRSAGDRATMTPYGMWAQTVAFARRGFVAVSFLRRGYGASGGGWAEGYGPCGNPDYASAGKAGASDIASVAKFMSTQPYVSQGKWISVGRSAGGFATIALPPMRRRALPLRSASRREGDREVRIWSAARSNSSPRLPNMAGHRACRCSGCRPGTIISLAHSWCRG
jgi:hypothetical protein